MTDRRKVPSTKQLFKAKAHPQGKRAGRLCNMDPTLGGFGIAYYEDWILLGLSGLGGAERYSGVVPTGGCLQAAVGYLPHIGRGSLHWNPTWPPFSKELEVGLYL